MSDQFDALAPKWDAMLCDPDAFVNYHEQARRFHWFMKRALKFGNRSRSFRLLDLGCGTGEAGWPLWRKVASVTFFDRSAEMLRLARNKYPKGVFVRGDARALPFLDNEFDVIVSRGSVLSMLKDDNEVKATLEGIQRIARPDAHVLLDFRTARDWPGAPDAPVRFTRGDFERTLREAVPTASIIAYDGTEAHAVNRILFRISKATA